MLHLGQAPILGKRVPAKPLTEGAAFKKLNEKDNRMGVQSYLTSSNISSGSPTPNASTITDA